MFRKGGSKREEREGDSEREIEGDRGREGSARQILTANDSVLKDVSG